MLQYLYIHILYKVQFERMNDIFTLGQQPMWLKIAL